MDGRPMVHAGWLRKSPPEKKLRLCAWRKRWFILWSSQCSGDPGALEYYKNDQSNKPLRIISLDLCEQLQANVTFHKKGLPRGFVFDIKTNERTFYLVADTKEDMFKWVQNICQVCGFQQKLESTDSVRTVSTASQEPCSSCNEPTLSCQQHLQDQRHSTLPHHSQPALLRGNPPAWAAQPPWSSRAPQQRLHTYLNLDQCLSRGAESARSDNASQESRNSFLVKSDMATQNVARGGGPCVPRIHGQAQGICIPSKPHWSSLRRGNPSCGFPQHMASRRHTTGNPTGSNDPHIFMAPIKTPPSAFRIPKTSIMDKSHSTVAVTSTGNKPMTTPCQPLKPSQAETPQQSCPSQEPVVRKKTKSVSFAATMPCHRDYQAVDRSLRHQASFPEGCKHYRRGIKSTGHSADSSAHADNFLQAEERDSSHVDEAGSGDDYVPMSTLPSILLVMERAGGNVQNSHNPRSPGSPHFVPPSCSPAARPSHKDLVRESEIQPPTVDCSLKPGHEAKPAALDSCDSVLGQPSSQSPSPISCTEVSSSSQDLRTTTESTISLHLEPSEGMRVLYTSRSTVISEEDNY